MTQKIKAELGRYEKFVSDQNVINGMQISAEVKQAVMKELLIKCSECKDRLLQYVQDLPLPDTDKSLQKPEKITYVSITETKSTATTSDASVTVTDPYKIWRNDLLKKVNNIYDRDLKYITPKEILQEIYKYMTSVYGICWEQDKKDWMNTHTQKPRTLEIIFNNTQYKSIFDSVLEDKYNQAILDHPSKYTFIEIMQPLVEKTKDKSSGGSATSRKIYARMELKYDIDWDKLLKKHFPTNHFAPKYDLFNIDHKLFEQFRMTVYEMLQEIKGKQETNPESKGA